ncbi:MAG: hypothetical protein GY694_20070 [Gammaproteobacteria bacterium]|nr:hypothetical protein [Gammaproteobacteria bacterium]
MNRTFITKLEEIKNGQNAWNYLLVRIFEVRDNIETEIGQYQRNYSGFYHSFFPFKKNGEWFALYSPDYTATRVMSLPDCKDLGGEEPHSNGFCPVDFYVPFNVENVMSAEKDGWFGFVAGCIWGDDSSWKIQHLDLSKVEEGIIVREEKYGYIAMPESIKRLSECFDFLDYEPPEYNIINIATNTRFDIDSGEQVGVV